MTSPFIIIPGGSSQNTTPMCAATYGAKAANLHDTMSTTPNVRIPYGVALPCEWTFTGNKMPHTTVMGPVRYLKALNDVNVMTFSVRSGAPVSMPGMMDTVMNVGLTRYNLQEFAESRNGSLAFAYEAYFRFLSGWQSSVLGRDNTYIENVIRSYKTYYRHSTQEPDLPAILKLIEDHMDYVIPEDLETQIMECVHAVHASWGSQRAKDYRQLNGISDDLGTGVLIQEMVYGNLNERSATGVVFSHNPNDGSEGWFGEFLVQAQGEEVVSGLYTPENIDRLAKHDGLAEAAVQLLDLTTNLADTERDIMDIEFTIEDGKLFLLQWRRAKATKRARARYVASALCSGTLTEVEAVDRILELVAVKKSVSAGFENRCVAKGLAGVSSGTATGVIAITDAHVEECKASNTPYIFVAPTTTPDDFSKMVTSAGILTSQGGATCHAVVVARGYDIVCVVGAQAIGLNEQGIVVDGETIQAGTTITINGETGEVFV